MRNESTRYCLLGYGGRLRDGRRPGESAQFQRSVVKTDEGEADPRELLLAGPSSDDADLLQEPVCEIEPANNDDCVPSLRALDELPLMKEAGRL